MKLLGQLKDWFDYFYVDWDIVIPILISAIVLGGLITLAVCDINNSTKGTRACLDAGYSETKVYLNGDVYCTKIVDGSSVTIKLISEGERK